MHLSGHLPTKPFLHVGSLFLFLVGVIVILCFLLLFGILDSAQLHFAPKEMVLVNESAFLPPQRNELREVYLGPIASSSEVQSILHCDAFLCLSFRLVFLFLLLVFHALLMPFFPSAPSSHSCSSHAN